MMASLSGYHNPSSGGLRMLRRLYPLLISLATVSALAAHPSDSSASAEPATPPAAAPAPPQATRHLTATVKGVKLFYREAGPANGPVVVLLHGFPTSSNM